MILSINDTLVLYNNNFEMDGVNTIKGLMLTKNEVSYLVNHLETLRDAQSMMVTKNISEIDVITEEVPIICLPESSYTHRTEIKIKKFKYRHIELFFKHLSQIMRWL